ncbi:galanin peptides-like, partial [Ailuropoda melanoleuca]|uniref:galanin peptides-like n=1 Tax=Ailuropoda melanoleuca TaxID=9646 RepID=UPI00149459C0
LDCYSPGVCALRSSAPTVSFGGGEGVIIVTRRSGAFLSFHLQTDAIDNHRSFHEKSGLTGKRELPPEDEVRPGGFARPLSENAAMRTIIEFLTFLHLKEAGALEYLPDLPAAVSAEDGEQP